MEAAEPETAREGDLMLGTSNRLMDIMNGLDKDEFLDVTTRLLKSMQFNILNSKATSKGLDFEATREEGDKLDVYFNEVCVMRQGSPSVFNKAEMAAALSKSDSVLMKLCLNLGQGKATAWGCDLSEQYVTINSAYTK